VAASDGGIYVVEVSGLALSSALDKTNPANGTGITYSVASGALSQNDEFVIGTVDGIGLGNPSGWTAIGSPNGSACGYKIVSANTAQTFSGSGSSGGWCAAIASFKAVSLATKGPTAAIASML
jgi:hypothetical protein